MSWLIAGEIVALMVASAYARRGICEGTLVMENDEIYLAVTEYALLMLRGTPQLERFVQ